MAWNAGGMVSWTKGTAISIPSRFSTEKFHLAGRRGSAALGKTTKWVLLDKCDALGVKLITGVNIQEIGDDYVNYLDAADKEQVINNVDYIYYATGVEPNDSLSKEIKLLNIKVEKIGDARKPQTVMEAVARGYKIGNAI